MTLNLEAIWLSCCHRGRFVNSVPAERLIELFKIVEEAVRHFAERIVAIRLQRFVLSCRKSWAHYVPSYLINCDELV